MPSSVEKDGEKKRRNGGWHGDIYCRVHPKAIYFARGRKYKGGVDRSIKSWHVKQALQGILLVALIIRWNLIRHQDYCHLVIWYFIFISVVIVVLRGDI